MFAAHNLKIIQSLILLFYIFLSGSISEYCIAQNDKLFELTPSVGFEYLSWGEYNQLEEQDLEEYGLVYKINLIAKSKFSENLGLYASTEGKFYYGIIDYNGYLQLSSGGTEPFKTETGYMGFDFCGNLGNDFCLGKNFILSPVIGIGYEYWERDIADGGQYGYIERWDFLYFNFCTCFIFPLSSSSEILLNISGKYPLQINESVNLSSRGNAGPSNINLNPGNNIGLDIELGTKTHGIFLSLNLEYLLFSSSPFNQGFHQPRSDRSLTGLNLGYSF